MTILLNQATTDPYAETYWQNLETALMARTIEATADLPPERRKALLSVWLQGVFDAAAVGLPQRIQPGWASRLDRARFASSPHLSRADRILLSPWPRLSPAKRNMGRPGHRRCCGR
jgi:hypothetical protein